MDSPTHKPQLAHNVKRLARLDLPGAGQVYVDGQYAYIGHIPNKSELGTSIIDVSDPRKPRVVSQIYLDDPTSHSHKARVIGDIMIVNSERNMTAHRPQGRRAAETAHGTAGGARTRADARGARGEARRARSRHSRGRGSRAQSVRQGRLQDLRRLGPREAEADHFPENARHRRAPLRHGCELRLHLDRDGGLHRQHPRHLRHSQSGEPKKCRAGGCRDSTSPAARSRPGPDASIACITRCAFGDRLWAGCWHGGVRIIDVSDIRKPRTIGEYNYHPPFPEPSHTFMGVPFPSAAARLRSRSTKKTTRTRRGDGAPPRPAARAACGYST